ncbi:MAG TPA: DUF4738 domain-containing protein [Bacteroidia bacterium]|nr:DUF4738 domain-containing protein [Bacteroidia bacterium]
MNKVLKSYIVFAVVLALAVSCKNNNQSGSGSDTQTTDSAGKEQSDLIEHYFPEKPTTVTTDTIVEEDNTNYRLLISQKTIDTSLVVFQRKGAGKVHRNIYYDFEYNISISGNGLNIGPVKITKHSIPPEEFDKDYIDHSILHDLTYVGLQQEMFTFTFMLTKPDTDLRYRLFYYMPKKGKPSFVVDDEFNP